MENLNRKRPVGVVVTSTEWAVLIEENRRMLKFASWRDHEAGIQGAEYLAESQLCDDIKAHTGRYDFGVCTEVLEHVIAVEETVEQTLLVSKSLLFEF